MMLIEKSSFEKEGISMVKTVLKIDGMSCSMCEAHMNEVIRNNFKVNKVSSSASAGETVIISDAELDIPWVKKQVKDIGYKVLSYESKPYEKKERKVSSILERNKKPGICSEKPTITTEEILL